MMERQPIKVEIQPRKLINPDIVFNQSYNEFEGELKEQADKQEIINQKHLPQLAFNQEQQKYQQIYKNVAKDNHKTKKIGKNKQKRIQTSSTIKLEEGEGEKLLKKKKEKKQINSNWKAFLNSNNTTKKNQSQFVGIDCEFVKCGDQQTLARFSAISQTGQVLLDTYVKPTQLITDYVTNFSGITYSHIKNAPSHESIIGNIKKILLGKWVVGHTVSKDLQVCGLNSWTGFKGIIDISESQTYSEKGKKISLKNLSMKYLGKSIQESWHSSVEDAQVAMELFLRKKKFIMKQKGFLK